MTTTLNSVYERYDDAVATVHDLEEASIPASEISLVANQPQQGDPENTLRTDNNMAESGAASGAAVGGTLGGATGLLAALGTFTIPGIGPVIGAGWLLAASMGAAVGASAGGVLGALIGAGVNKDQATVYVEALRKGGTLVSARVADDKVHLVDEIMRRRKTVDVAVAVRDRREDPTMPTTH